MTSLVSATLRLAYNEVLYLLQFEASMNVDSLQRKYTITEADTIGTNAGRPIMEFDERLPDNASATVSCQASNNDTVYAFANKLASSQSRYAQHRQYQPAVAGKLNHHAEQERLVN